MVVQNLLSERKLPMRKVPKKTNNSAFSATHTYIKLTLVSFFYSFISCTFPLFGCAETILNNDHVVHMHNGTM